MSTMPPGRRSPRYHVSGSFGSISRNSQTAAIPASSYFCGTASSTTTYPFSAKNSRSCELNTAISIYLRLVIAAEKEVDTPNRVDTSQKRALHEKRQHGWEGLPKRNPCGLFFLNQCVAVLCC